MLSSSSAFPAHPLLAKNNGLRIRCPQQDDAPLTANDANNTAAAIGHVVVHIYLSPSLGVASPVGVHQFILRGHQLRHLE